MTLKTMKNSALDLHNKLIDEHGVDNATGFSKRSQTLRFDAITRCAGFDDDWPGSLLDYGCATGDFYAYLQEVCAPVDYVGMDINEQMLTRLSERFPGVKTVHGDILAGPFLATPSFGFVVASGVFSYADRQPFHRQMLGRLYAAASRSLVVNFLRVHEPKEHQVPHCFYEPADAQIMAERLGCRSFVILADYLPNDFTVAFYKPDEDSDPST